MISLIISESALELVPFELEDHPSVVSHARKLGKYSSEILLDNSWHFAAMKGIKNEIKRGRPDLVHFSILEATTIPLYLQNKLNIFDLNLNFPFVYGDPIIRFLASDNQISKVIAYCQDGDEDGRIDDWYQTIFYLNRNGKIFLENNNPSGKEVEEMDPWGLIADFEADKDFRDGLFDMI